MKKKIIISFSLTLNFLNFFSQNNNDLESIQIGKQVWTKKNLTVTSFRNGDPIKLAQTAEEWKAACDSKAPAYCYYSFQSEINALEKQEKIILENEKKFTINSKFSYENDSLITELKKQVEELLKKQGKSKKYASKIEEFKNQITVYNSEKDANYSEWKKNIEIESSKIKSELDIIIKNIDSLKKIEEGLGKGSKYGFLYNFYAVIDPRGIAPEGWKIPTNIDWDELEKSAINFLKNSNVNSNISLDKNIGPSNVLKSQTNDWFEKKAGKNFIGNGNNLLGFNGLPGGWRIQFNNKFLDINNFAYFWTSTPVPSSQTAYARGLDCTKTEIWKDTNSFNGGLSVRLIKSEKGKK